MTSSRWGWGISLNKGAAMELHKAGFKAMGSRCELQLYGPKKRAQAIAGKAVALVRELEKKYSRYRDDSVTSRINKAAGSGEFIEVDEETAGLLDFAEVLYQQSDGLFDITSGILRQAWDFKSNRRPDAQLLAQLLPRVGWPRVEWQSPWIRLPDVGMELDFGGYVKEYTADKVADLCRDLGINHGLVNLGGDIHLLGPHPDGSPWQVGIQNPRRTNGAIASISLTEGAIATSGDYERYMIIDGVRYCHLLNPYSGASLQPRFASASVIGARCLIAGAFSTIALLKSPAEPEWLAEQGLPYLLIDTQLRLHGTLEAMNPSIHRPHTQQAHATL